MKIHPLVPLIFSASAVSAASLRKDGENGEEANAPRRMKKDKGPFVSTSADYQDHYLVRNTE
jgi:hypothetical protein